MPTIKLLFEITPPTEGFPFWTASYPEIDLATQGETRQKALNNAAEALEMWLSSLAEDGILETEIQTCAISSRT